ncbi:nucleotidyl transferase AbiEii/AbiGii toxin family protein [Streptomyces sp. NPDC006733]|uniref:nucleotidyl transferase AbiEii/AbiGii toxin family protein n=1 Tax=Streptomyces sp. NPDC006733 TaxID=3155460 RepID=UPI0033E62BCA
MKSSSDDPAQTWARLGWGTADIPHAELDEATRLQADLPRTLLPAPHGAEQPAIFDPALKQFARAYRAGEPRFRRAAKARAWHRARRTALDGVLAAIAAGPWASHLVLRGSVLMATWFPEVARDPGDLDFVVVPQDWVMDGPESAGLFAGLAQDAAAACAGGPVRIDAAGMVTEEIWTYDRVPGRRMLLPWTAAGTAGGSIQLDLVFNEPLPVPAELTDLRPLGDGPGCRLLAASTDLSLAWKLLWLISDAYPQGKDLYDAVLLAEHTGLSYEVLRDAFVLGGFEGLRPPGQWWFETLEVGGEWEHFTTEHPWVQETAEHFTDRLHRALAPLLAAAEQHDPYTQWVCWLQPLVESTRATPPADQAASLAPLARGGRDGLTAAVIILRETVGRQVLTTEDALRIVLAADDAWSAWRDDPPWRSPPQIPHPVPSP